MTTRYATPSTSQQTIQDWLNALDYVVLSSGSQYGLAVDNLANQGLGWSVPAGATLDLNGAVVVFASALNQSRDGDGAAAVGCRDRACGVIRNGTIRAADDRVVAGQPQNHSNRLLYFDANGIDMGGLVEDLILLNGPNQALQMNNAKGMVFRRVSTPRPLVVPTASSVYLGHYVDLDVTARGRYTENVLFDDCDLDAFGQDCLKLENCRAIRFANCRFRSYVTLVQDGVDPYSELDDIEFDTRCVYFSYVQMRNLRRRWNGIGYDNFGGGRVTLRGRMSGDDALILGGLKSAVVEGTEAEQFANLRAEFMSFEGSNSHLVPLPDSSWIRGCLGVKQRVTIHARRAASAHYPFAVVPCVVAGNVIRGSTLTNVVQNSLAAQFVGPYGLAGRGVRVVVEPGIWTGSANRGGWPSLNQNVAVDFIGDGGSAGTIIDAEDSTGACLVISGSNSSRVRFFGFTLRRSKNGTSSRGWLVNNPAANVEFHDVVSEDCSCLNPGGGGRAQNYARLVLGPGTTANGCKALGSSHGGGFQIDLAGIAVCEIEGARVMGCTAGGTGGGMRISSPYCRVRTLELVGNAATIGAGGLAVSFSIGGATMKASGVSGRGNLGAPGQGNDVGLFVGHSTSKVVLRSSVLGSGGGVLTKGGPGGLDFADINFGASGTYSLSGGLNSNLGGIQNVDPQFVADSSSVELSAGSPARAAAIPQWDVDVERVPVSRTGDWFQLSASGRTTMGASP